MKLVYIFVKHAGNEYKVHNVEEAFFAQMKLYTRRRGLHSWELGTWDTCRILGTVRSGNTNANINPKK